MLDYEDITLRRPEEHEAKGLYELMISDERWTEFDGPYFGYKRPTFEGFSDRMFLRLRQGVNGLAIDYQGRLVGTVTYYWEDKNTRWLEAGIVIFDSNLWDRGLGRKALIPWVTALFDSLEIERVGLTTWSGNPRMIQCAIGLSFTIEGRLRKVRYYNGRYYDSIKLGVTREEWNAFIADKPLRQPRDKPLAAE